jgi:pimeloyl-ACP methyl ester carboxylesterase
MFSETTAAHEAPERITIPFPGGDLSARVSGPAQGAHSPVLLVHSINAAASHAEMDALARQLEGDRRVYNLDLPGFGESARPAIRYDIRRFVAAIEMALEAIIAAGNAKRVDVVALSLSCEFAARAAAEHPEQVRSLTLISPTGFQKGAHLLTGPRGASLERPWLSAIFSSAAGRLLYKGLTVRGSIRYFLRRTFGGPHVDGHVYQAAVRSAAQPGAEHAPLAFLSGRLFSRDIMAVYQALQLPVFMIHGTKGDFSDFTNAVWTESRANWTRRIHETGALPHVERPAEVAEQIQRFLRQDRPDAPPGSAPSSPHVAMPLPAVEP